MDAFKIIIVEMWDIFLGIIMVVIGLTNWIFFHNYLKKKKSDILERISNKKSLINLPALINLQPYFFISYIIKFDKEDDARIIFHKKVHLICLILFLFILIYALIIRRFLM